MTSLARCCSRASALLVGLLFLQGCATAPKPSARAITVDQPMTALRDESFAQSERFIDDEAVLTTIILALPRVRIAEGAVPEGISEAQAGLVANRAAREVCNGLAPYVRLHAEAEDPAVEVVLTSIRATSTAASGASAVLGIFVPGPFRLPAGLGGLAAEGALRKNGETVYLLRWTEGADAITEDARVSSIGDAYQLANDFADDFVDGFADPRGEAAPDRARVDDATRKANAALCLARFGRANVAGRGASILLPLAPEAIDPGAPLASPLPDMATGAAERIDGAF